MPAITALWAARPANDAAWAAGAGRGEGCVLTLQNALAGSWSAAGKSNVGHGGVGIALRGQPWCREGVCIGFTTADPLGVSWAFKRSTFLCVYAVPFDLCGTRTFCRDLLPRGAQGWCFHGPSPDKNSSACSKHAGLFPGERVCPISSSNLPAKAAFPAFSLPFFQHYVEAEGGSSKHKTNPFCAAQHLHTCTSLCANSEPHNAEITDKTWYLLSPQTKITLVKW